MLKKCVLLLIMVAVMTVIMPRVEAKVIFNDGKEHTINYTINGWVEVYDGTTPPLPDVTAVNVVSGGSIKDWIMIYDNSRANVSGGSIGDWLDTFDNGRADISGGLIGQDVWAFNNSQINVSGGWITDELRAYDNSTITFSGGSIMNLEAYRHGQVNYSGGLVRGSIYAGTDIPYEPTAYSIINIYGSGFNYDFGPITVSSGRLIGTLANGDPINNDFYIYDEATIILVPEPATVLLLGLGGLALLRKRKT